jgi:hypothetical protein
MSIETELRINRRNTLAFIAARPTVITLIPVEKVKTPSGGTRLQDLPPRTAQTLRVIDQNSHTGNVPGLLTSTDGRQLKAVFQLLGPYDAVMAVGDHWAGEGKERFEIAEMLPFNGYERRGGVVRLA